MYRGAVAVVSACALAGVAACAAFGEGKEDLAPAPSADGAAPEEATTVDGGANVDADARPEESCPAEAFWCETFENGLAAWGAPSPGVVTAPTGDHGRVLFVTAPAGETQHTIARSVQATGSTLRLTTWLRVKPVGYLSEPDSANYAVAAIKDPTGGLVFVAVYLWRDTATTATAQLTGATSEVSFRGTAPTTLSYDAWHEVEIALTLGPSGAMEWFLDGTRIDGAALASPPTIAFEVMLGVRRTNLATPTVELEQDDVVVRP